MVTKTNKTLTTAISQILRPLVRILLRNGISCGTFEEMVRKAYVDEAFAQAQRINTKATISSVSAETGLSRKEVKRLHELELSDSENTVSLREVLGRQMWVLRAADDWRGHVADVRNDHAVGHRRARTALHALHTRAAPVKTHRLVDRDRRGDLYRQALRPGESIRPPQEHTITQKPVSETK